MAVNYNAPIEIRDSRNGSWFWIHTHVWRDSHLTQSSKVVYGTIASYTNTEQTAFPSITKISLDSDISERHVYRCLKELEKFNYLKVERKHGKPNLYTLVKTTPDIMSPLTGSHPTPDKKASTTPDKSTVLTISNEQELINKKEYTHLEDVLEKDLEEIADHYQVPISFVKSEYEDMCLWVGQRPGNFKLRGRNWRLTLMAWVKKDAIKLMQKNTDPVRRPINGRGLSNN